MQIPTPKLPPMKGSRPGPPMAARGDAGKADAPMTTEPKSANEIVRENSTAILVAYVMGDSLDSIGKKLKPHPLTGMQIRFVLMKDAELRQRLEVAIEHRAHWFFEKAAESAVKCEQSGDYGRATEVLMKVAERMLPAVYGPKAELTVLGRIEHDVVVDGKIGMTPDEAYLRMIGSAK